MHLNTGEENPAGTQNQIGTPGPGGIQGVGQGQGKGDVVGKGSSGAGPSTKQPEESSTGTGGRPTHLK